MRTLTLFGGFGSCQVGFTRSLCFSTSAFVHHLNSLARQDVQPAFQSSASCASLAFPAATAFFSYIQVS